jgi:uncharacterized protein (DUF488 family)
MTTLYTVGHGTRTTEELASVVRGGGANTIVDVRRFPGSRRHPHFSRDALAADLPRLGVAYEWWGEALGGRRKRSPASRHIAWRNDAFAAYADHMDSGEFQVALKRLESTAATSPLAIMCSETLWWRCHRRLIADALTLRDHEVIHLGAGKPQTHPLNPAARADGSGRVVYDVGEQAPLPLEEGH